VYALIYQKAGKVAISKIDDAPNAYGKFVKRVEGYIKILIHPQW